MIELLAFSTAVPKEKAYIDSVERYYPLDRYYYYTDLKLGLEPKLEEKKVKKLVSEKLNDNKNPQNLKSTKEHSACNILAEKSFKVLFDFNKFNIKPEYQKQLEENFSKLKGKIKAVYISAYTDKIGSYKANQYIALMRANSVKEFLSKFTDKIYFKEVKGKCCYVLDKDYLNRRAEIKVIYVNDCNKN